MAKFLYKIPLKVNRSGFILSKVTSLGTFWNIYFKNIFFSEDHLVATKIIWLKDGFFKRLLLPKLVSEVCLENQIFKTQD